MKALITGASRGIGRAIAEYLASKSYELILIAHKESTLASLAADLMEIGAEEVNYYAVNLADPAVKMEVIQDLPRDLDVIINNLGVYEEDTVQEISSGSIHQQLALNAYPAIDITNSLLPTLKEKGKGAVVFVGSITTERVTPHAVSYTLSKRLLSDYVEHLRGELKGTGIKIAEIVPTAVNTSSWDGIDAPKEQFVQSEDVVMLLETVLKAGKHVNIDKLTISSSTLDY